jgi:large subunit ribosomal protein L21
MYAVIRTGGKQYRVAENDVIAVEKLAAEAGASVEFGEVLALDKGAGPVLGAPLIAGAKVAATVLEQKKDDKVVIFKKRQRQTYRRMRGHRQPLTVVRITGITAP